jgi:hypothetical protein
MPREQINFPKSHPAVVTGISPAEPWPSDTPPTFGEVTYDYVDPRLHVNWLRVDDFGAGHVQLSLEAHPQDILGRANDARAILDKLAPAAPGEMQTLSADTSIFQYTPTLTRDEINKLIRVLRRARDAVYGSDE